MHRQDIPPLEAAMTDYDDDFRQQAEQQRDLERMADTAREALARCVGVAMTDEEVDAILCLAGLHNPKVGSDYGA